MKHRIDSIISREYNSVTKKFELYYRTKRKDGHYAYLRKVYDSLEELWNVKVGDYIEEEA